MVTHIEEHNIQMRTRKRPKKSTCSEGNPTNRIRKTKDQNWFTNLISRFCNLESLQTKNAQYLLSLACKQLHQKLLKTVSVLVWSKSSKEPHLCWQFFCQEKSCVAHQFGSAFDGFCFKIFSHKKWPTDVLLLNIGTTNRPGVSLERKHNHENHYHLFRARNCRCFSRIGEKCFWSCLWFSLVAPFCRFATGHARLQTIDWPFLTQKYISLLPALSLVPSVGFYELRPIT